MIEPHQLRLGNLVEYNIADLRHTPDWVLNVVDWEDIRWAVEENGSFNEMFRPIPLTEELFDKLELNGVKFEKSIMPFTGLEGYSIRTPFAFIGLTSENERGWRFANPHFDLIIEHAHNLQNIVKDLTNQELKLEAG